MTGLTSIAEKPIAASGIVRHMVALVGRLIAGVDRTGNAVIAVWWRTRLTTKGYMTGLASIAE